ncbi:hypothetical protein ACHAPT_009025 [Fusarium lateritium]
MVWECNALTECECRRQSDRSSRPLTAGRTKDLEGMYEQWRLLVREYTKRALSEETDKLPAFRGLAASFQHMICEITGGKPDEYLAGLWRGDLAAQLAWKPPTPDALSAFMKATRSKKAVKLPNDSSDWLKALRQRNQQEDWHRTKGYVAPSWSWAHLHGPVSYLTSTPRTPFKSYVGILEASTVPRVAGQPTGQVESGSIKLRGFMIRDMKLTVVACGYNDGSMEYLSVLTYGEDDEFHVEIGLDDAPTVVRERGCDSSGVVVVLLGTKDFTPVEGAIMEGISPPRRIQQKDKVGSCTHSTPDEIAEAFQQFPVLIRWSSYLVLAESKTDLGKYERLACFDVWGPQVEVMARLFAYSVKGDVTII